MSNKNNARLEENKAKFLTILEAALKDRPGADFNGLKAKLETSDFFTAPASTKYHNSFEGGLCEHSLNVYNNMINFIGMKGLSEKLSYGSVAIVALLHDMSKINLYTKSARNKKVYYDAGSKHDNLGNFDWVSEMSYAILPDDERFIYGNHEETSEYMIRTYIPLTYEESAAILHHHGGCGWDSCNGNVGTKVMHRYLLAALLHLADMSATFVDEVWSETTNE